MLEGQRKRTSVIEVSVNLIVGLVVSLVLTHLMFEVSLARNILITAVFTFASVVRSYILRRMFNYFTLRGQQ